MVTPAMQSVWPDDTSVLFLYTSARRSNFVAWSPLFFRPSHACRGPRAVSVPVVSAGCAGQVPTSFQGLPPLKLMLDESLYFAVVAVGAVLSRKSVGGLAVPPLPCRKKSGVVWEEIGWSRAIPRTAARITGVRSRERCIARSRHAGKQFLCTFNLQAFDPAR